MNPNTPADWVQKMELRRAALAIRQESKAGDMETSPTDAQGTAPEAALTLSSFAGGVNNCDSDSDTPFSPSNATRPATVGRGKRPAAAGLASSSTSKVGRWKPVPAAAFMVAAAAATGSAEGTTAGVTIAPLLAVSSGPSHLVGPPAPGAPAGLSREPSPADDGPSSVVVILGPRNVHQGVSLRP